MKRWMLLLVLLSWMTIPAQAVESDAIQSFRSAARQNITAGMTGETQSMVGELSLDNCTNLAQVLAVFGAHCRSRSGDALKTTLVMLAKVMVILILCSCVAGFPDGTGGSPLFLTMAGALGMTAVVSSDLMSLMSLCKSTAEELSVLSTSMLPVVMTAASLCGAAATGVMLFTATEFAFHLCVALIAGVLLPMVSAYIAMITVNAALGNGILTRLADFLRWLISSTLKILLSAFIGYITVFGAVTRSTDATAVRAAKFALSGTVPVVGSILSNAAETVLSSASVVKNAVGVFGMLCVIAVCLLPFIRLGLSYLLFRAGTAILSPICPTSLLGLMDGLTRSFGLILGMLGSCCMILFFELAYAVIFITGV